MDAIHNHLLNLDPNLIDQASLPEENIKDFAPAASSNQCSEPETENTVIYDDSEEEDSEFPFSLTPGGSHVWIPQCPEEIKPKINMLFSSLDAAISFYENYAKVCGFSVARSTAHSTKSGTISRKVLLCNKQGYIRRRNYSTNTLQPEDQRKRGRKSVKCGCNAKCGFHFDGIHYYIYTFVEEHRHELTSENSKQFLKENKHLGLSEQKLIIDCANVKIGASKAFDLMEQMAGDYVSSGTTKTDVKNFKRDLKIFIGDSDAQMLINHYTKKMETQKDFIFEFYAEKDGTLSRLFWADATSRRDGKLYDNVVSFDATYNKNK